MGVKMNLDWNNLTTQCLEQLEVNIIHIEPLTGGANSQAAKLVGQTGHTFFLKMYLNPLGDNRDRLGTEFNSLQFLWNQGLRSIPQPLFAEVKNNFAVYSFIHGRLLNPPEITPSLLSEIVNFWSSLQKLIYAEEANSLPKASEACFSISEYLANVEIRLQRLTKAEDEILSDFLYTSLLPTWEDIKAYVLAMVSPLNLEMNHSLSLAERTLSPSDVGFHNILSEEPSHRLVFIDFEYFGWDDPVKMMCDFMLQPARPLPINLAPIVMQEMLKHFPVSEQWRKRFRCIFPMIGFKWCLIMLNPFLPERKATLGSTREMILSTRLSQAKQKLAMVNQQFQLREFNQWV